MSILRSTLASLIQHARLHPNQLFKTKLKGGLGIRLKYIPEINRLFLELHRATAHPSTIEWYTVLNHLPFLAHFAPTRSADNGSFTLHATIPIQEPLL